MSEGDTYFCFYELLIKKFKQWIFLRKLNKAIKGYGARAHISKDNLHIIMRNYNCNKSYSYLRNKYKQDNCIICQIIKEIRIKNVKEAYE